MNSADVVGQKRCPQVLELGRAVHERSAHSFAFACGQDNVVVQVVDGVPDVERQRLLTAGVEEARELGSGTVADLGAGESHAPQSSTSAVRAARAGVLTRPLEILRWRAAVRRLVELEPVVEFVAALLVDPDVEPRRLPFTSRTLTCGVWETTHPSRISAPTSSLRRRTSSSAVVPSGK